MLDDRDTDDASERPAAAGDHAAGRLLDEQAATESFANLEPADRRRVADLQWLHSLLAQVLQRDAVARDRRITRVCLAVRDDAARQVQPGSDPRRTRRVWLAPVAMAAALVLAAVIFRGQISPPRSAIAAVESSLKEAQSSPDRRYHVQTQWQSPGGDVRERTGELWVRGATHFLLQQESPLGELFIGSNGEEHWLAPAIGPVFVADDLRAFEQMLPGKPLATPFLQVTTMLERLADRCDLSLAAEEELPAVDGKGTVRCTHVVGRKRVTEDALSPDVIELWTARQSGVAYRIVARWTSDPDRVGPREVQLNWAPLNEPVATEWYDHASHHQPDRRVIRRTDGDANEAEL